MTTGRVDDAVEPAGRFLLTDRLVNVRKQGATAFAAGLACWALNLALALNFGMYGVSMVIIGGLLVFAGAVGLVWGDSFKKMTVPEKIPAALIALMATLAPAVLLVRWIERLGNLR